MIEWSIHWKPVYRLVLTSEHVAVLMKLSQLHYSPECVAASRPGGFLFGWTNQATYANKDDPPPAMGGDGRDLDICLKIMEMSDFPGLLNESERRVRDELRIAIPQAINRGRVGP